MLSKIDGEYLNKKGDRKQIQAKLRIEAMLRRHGYRHDQRPDHREWWKSNSAFNVEIRLDQNNPDGWNGFQFMLTTHMRRDMTPAEMEKLLVFLKKEF